MHRPRSAVLRIVDGDFAAQADLAHDEQLAARERFFRAVQRVQIVFQPVVWAQERRVFGYEALVRSTDTSLPGPHELFGAAGELGEVLTLERKIRTKILETVPQLPEPLPVFVNVHPEALDDPELSDPAGPLAVLGDRIIIEMTERAPLDSIEHLGDKLATLRGLGFRIAVDDLGAGYHGLRTFAETNPDIVKFDMSLVRGIDAQPVKADLLRSMIEICRDLKIRCVGVGVETDAERDRLVALGCDLLQGFRFARPHWPVPEIAW